MADTAKRTITRESVRSCIGCGERGEIAYHTKSYGVRGVCLICLPANCLSGVYVIRGRTTGLLKIGRSVNALRRLESLQLGSPDDLELVALLPGDGGVESELHRRFSAYRVRGEWFKPAQDLVEWVYGVAA